MESNITVAKHSVHKALVVFPLGLLLTAVVFDLIYISTGTVKWAEIAFYVMTAGIIGGIIAAPFGWGDWLSIPAGSRAKKIGLLHGIGNAVVLILFIGSWFIRRDNVVEAGTWAYAFSFLGAVLSLVTGWLGAELVDRMGVSIQPGANVNAPSSLSDQKTYPRSTDKAA